jgi:hypothetical protein
MRRSQGQEGGNPEDDILSDDASSRITKCETYVDHYMYQCCRESLTPYIVTSQDSQSLRMRLMSRGVGLGVDFVLRQPSKS